MADYFCDTQSRQVSHSSHNVFFMYDVFLMQASFETPWFAAGNGCNMSFFYHMSDRSSGNNMGTLLVEVKTVDKTWFAVFWKAGNQGDKWHQGNVDLSVRSLSLFDKLVLWKYGFHLTHVSHTI